VISYCNYQCSSPTLGLASLRLDNIFPPIPFHNAGQIYHHLQKIDLSSIPEEYHKYADVFSKSKTETLAPYCPYDLWIELEKDSHPPVETIYSLSKFEQKALKEFIDKNLNNGFIRSTSSSHGVLVLFVKKKDRSL